MAFARLSFYLILLTYPFYLLPSGGVQLSTAFVLLTFVAILVAGWRQIAFSRPIARQLVFVIYTMLVNIAWYFQSYDADFLLYVLFAGVAAIVFFCAATLARTFDQRAAQMLVFLLFASLVIQLLIVVFGLGEESVRAVAFFNNPNQLAYYAAGCAGMALVLGHRYALKSLYVPATALVAVPLSALTLSRAGAAACVLYVLLNVASSRALSAGRRFVLIVVIVAAVFVGYERFVKSPTFEGFRARVEATDSAEETTEQRGYQRILENTAYMIWGAGEGAFERFDEEIELHSYPGTLLFSYGLIGVALFLWFLRAAIPDRRTLVYLVPLLIYNLTHNGGRSLVLWALLGLMAATTMPSGHGHGSQGRKRRRRRRRTRPEPSRVAPDIDLTESSST